MKKLNHKNALAATVSMLMTMMVCSSVSRASDIEIYQNAQPTTITLMMLIDISGSMDYMSHGGGSACDPGGKPSSPLYTYDKSNPHTDVPVYRRQFCGTADAPRFDRITRVKDGMMDLLFGNESKRISALSGDKLIGLSTIGWVRDPLLIDPKNSGKLLWDGTTGTSPMTDSGNMDKLKKGASNTYKDERGGTASDWENYGSIVVPARRLDETLTINGVSITQRKYLAQKVAELAAVTNTPTASAYAETAAYLLGTSTKMSGGYFGFESSNENAKNGDNYVAPASMTQTEDQKQCHGQGIYVLTDGEPYDYTMKFNDLAKLALNSSDNVCNSPNNHRDVWGCINNLAGALLDPNKNPKGVKIKTAVVGFGNSFNNIKSYDPTKSKAENIEALGNIDEAVNKDVTKKAAKWGINAEGGWYSGKNTEDVVNSVQQFLGQIEVEIPAVATGSPTLPQDALNPLRIQPYGYYASFVPKPQESTQLWVGNMNKYHIFNGELYDNSKTIRLIKTDGSLDSTAEGLWINGMKGQLPLGIGTNAANEQVANRTIYTNREITGTAAPYAASETNSLKKVNVATLFGTGSTALFVNDPDKNYWLNLLGYNVGATETGITLANLTTKPELRQVGAVMHSTPILLTQSGKIKVTSGALDTTERDDYLLFGTTQGLLHVVDADDGKEKFTFAPNEMMKNQKAAFLSETSSTGGTASLFYGIDAPWTAFTQYVSKSNGTLTVKGSERNTDGSTYNSSNTNLELKGLQWVYGGLRMGGKSYYALNLSDLDNPELKFHIDPANSKIYKSGSSTATTVNALSYMGQSWSKPTIAYVKFGGVKKLVMFVGGGYDEGYENAAYNQTNGIGAGVYMFDANNGDLLWWTSANATAAGGAEAFTDASASTINMKYSVVSQINAIDRDSDGLVDNLYFGDLGGQAFRVDLNNAATGADASAKKANFAKRVVRLFSENVTTGASPRFYEMPSVSIHEDNGYVAAVAFSSGNRSSPLVGAVAASGRNNQAGSTVSAADGVFVVYDKDVAKTDLYASPTLTTQNISFSSLNTNISTGVPVTGNNGWKYIYSNTAGVYKGMNELYALDGMLYVNVFHRDGTGIGGSCGAGVKGDSYVYQFCLPTGKCPFNTTTSGVPNSVKLGAGILGVGLGQGRSSANNTGLIVNRPNTLNCTTSPNLPECQEFTTTAKLRQLRWYETR